MEDFYNRMFAINCMSCTNIGACVLREWNLTGSLIRLFLEHKNVLLAQEMEDFNTIFKIFDLKNNLISGFTSLHLICDPEMTLVQFLEHLCFDETLISPQDLSLKEVCVITHVIC